MVTDLRKHIAALTLVLLVSALLVTQVSQPVFNWSYTPETEQTDLPNSDEAGSEATHAVVSADLALNSISHLNIHQEFYQIREIILDEVTDTHVVYVAHKLAESDHFKILFRNVISTNAP